jgi:hypothetical protein
MTHGGNLARYGLRSLYHLNSMVSGIQDQPLKADRRMCGRDQHPTEMNTGSTNDSWLDELVPSEFTGLGITGPAIEGPNGDDYRFF